MINARVRLAVLCSVFVLAVSCASSPEFMGGGEAEAPAPARYYAPAGGESPAVEEGRMVAYSVSLALDVDDAGATRKALAEQTKIHEGFITRETANHVQARIPAKNMDAFLGGARRLGKVERETKTGTDITDKYRDDMLRLESLKNIRNRYQALLEKADTVNDMLGIEKELERVNTQIEVLEGRQKYAQQSVSFADISVSFEKQPKPGPIGWIFYGLYQGIKWLFVWE
ncbi:MAG: DUF4349 domain-containing protein [Spirochaetia bacterium]|jgi:hypothetical protein|nr:DUF4349 domain-containing protein [Spirochaetia bacterium]